MEYNPIPINMLKFDKEYRDSLDGNFQQAKAVIHELNRQNDLMKNQLRAALVNPTGGGNPEVTAARVALNGTTHGTLYDHIIAVEQQIEANETLINNLSGNITDFNKVISLETAAASYYVNGATGSDDPENNGSQATPFKTVGRAISEIPIISMGRIYNIYIADGTYDEEIIITNRSGSLILLIGNSNTPANVKIRNLIGNDNASYMNVTGLYATSPDKTQFQVERCSYVNFTNVHATVNNKVNNNAGISYITSRGVVVGSVTSNGVYGVYVGYNSQINLGGSNSGSGNTTGVHSAASVIHKSSANTITGTTNESYSLGGIISNGGIIG